MGAPTYTPPAKDKPQTSRPFFAPEAMPDVFFKPAEGDKTGGEGEEKAAAPATAEKPPAAGATTAEPPKSEIGFGSFKVFCDIFDDLILQWPTRWQQSYLRAKENGSSVLFDQQFGQDLISKEIMALWNLYYGFQLKSISPYGKKVDLSKAFEMAQQLSGVSDMYISLASIALHMDMKKYLSDKIPEYAKKNLGIFLISGALLQSGLVGLNALTGSDLDFTSLLGPATSTWTEAPLGLKRPYVLNNIPDDRWRSPFSSTPDKFELKYTGLNTEADEKKWSLGLGFNIAAAQDLYPKDEKEKAKYKGFELFPYFSFSNKQPIEGKPAPSEENKFMAGFFVGDKGYYGLLEGGARLEGKTTLEAYGRGGFVMKNFGPLSLMQLTGEVDYRPGNDAEIRGRINAATSFELLDGKEWQLKLGAAAGGLIPSGGQPGAFDFRTNMALNYKYAHPDFTRPLNIGFNAGFDMSKQDPFDANSPDRYGVLGQVTFFDIMKFGLEYYQIDAKSDTLPNSDLRAMFAMDLAPIFMQITQRKKEK